ncbi:MAG TPA: hypothetical protein VN680_16250 [Burkholderiaceae bacterium]|jgi:hypothetical protein|nr:hypothetical protein [Burkholderiaceae bacterium]
MTAQKLIAAAPQGAIAAGPGAVAWVELVDFKWLMAGQGWWVDLGHLQRDRTYALACVRRGMASNVAPLREACRRLRPLFRRSPALAGSIKH